MNHKSMGVLYFLIQFTAAEKLNEVVITMTIAVNNYDVTYILKENQKLDRMMN